MNEHYAAVLADLRVRRARLEEEIEEIDGVIAGMERLAQVGASTAPPSQPIIFEPSPPMMPTRSANGPLFANISMRWSVLWHLTEFAKGFQKTGEITASLRENGYQTAAANLGNMVSAVLSRVTSSRRLWLRPTCSRSLPSDRLPLRRGQSFGSGPASLRPSELP